MASFLCQTEFVQVTFLIMLDSFWTSRIKVWQDIMLDSIMEKTFSELPRVCKTSEDFYLLLFYQMSLVSGLLAAMPLVNICLMNANLNS